MLRPAGVCHQCQHCAGRLGSLHVRLYDTHNDVPLRGGELTLYQVASVKRTNGNLYFDYTGDFTGCGVVLGRSFRQHAGLTSW